MVEGDPPQGRREFFRQGWARLLRPVAEYIERRLPVGITEKTPLLRPPGAIPEDRFRETCLRCGNCVTVCPVRAIQFLESDDLQTRGTPVIDPNVAACVVCDELACTKVCPSGALQRLDDPAMIRMGLAVVDHGACVRSRGENCTICLDKCPFGTAAIRLGDLGKVQVIEQGCVGCGVCQLYCPTKPKAIVVEPR